MDNEVQVIGDAVITVINNAREDNVADMIRDYEMIKEHGGLFDATREQVMAEYAVHMFRLCGDQSYPDLTMRLHEREAGGFEDQVIEHARQYIVREGL